MFQNSDKLMVVRNLRLNFTCFLKFRISETVLSLLIDAVGYVSECLLLDSSNGRNEWSTARLNLATNLFVGMFSFV